MNEAERAVLDVYVAEVNRTGSRKVALDKHALSSATGIHPSRCCNARSALIARGCLRKIGFSRPMRVEVLA